MGNFPDEEYEGNVAYEILYYIPAVTKKDMDPSFDFYQHITPGQFRRAKQVISEFGTHLSQLEKMDPSSDYFSLEGNNIKVNKIEGEIQISTEFDPMSDEVSDLARMVNLPAPIRKINFSRN